MPSRLHDTDYYSWTQRQARLLRSGHLSKVDADLLAEEIEDMGNEIRAACFSFITHIIEHLLKLNYSLQDQPKAHWRGEVVNFRSELDDRLTNSIKRRVDMDRLYERAIRLAAARLDEPGFAQRLPASCPWTLAQIRDQDFWPDIPPTDPS